MNEEEMTRFIAGNGSDITPEEANRRLAQAHEHNASNEENAPQASRHIYSHYSFAEACKTAKPKEYLISGHVQAKGLHMTYGEPASGKTFLVLDQAATIACEEIVSWQGRHVKHGHVIYFAGEASEGVKIRCAGWAIARGINPENVHMTIIDEVFSLDDDTDTEHDIETTIANIEACASNVVYIIIDTLHAFMNGDENLAKDTKKMQDACRKLRQKFGCAVNIIHHVGVSQDAKGRARGSSSWKGAMDIETLVQQEDSNESGITCRITQKKHKDGKKCKSFTLKMNEVVLPDMFDDEGRQVTTLVPETESTIITTNSQEKGSKVNLTYKRGLKTFKEAAIRHGRLSCDDTAGESFVDVSLEQWREVAYEILDGEKNTKKTQFNRAKTALIEDKEPPLITHYEHEGITFYRLARHGDNSEETFRAEIFAAVIKRDEGKKKSANEDETSAVEATGNLF